MNGKYRPWLLVPLLVILTGLSAACGAPAATTPEDITTPPEIPSTSVNITRDVEYGRGGDIPLLLDIYQPQVPIISPMPAIVWIHGGGWQAGDKYPARAQVLASRGFLVVSINYRLSGVAPFPATVEDCKCAIRWLRAHAADYDVDPQRIGVWGGSAGGHLAMMVGTADAAADLEGDGGWKRFPSRVQAVCSYYGPSDFVGWYQGTAPGVTRDTGAIQLFLGGTMADKPDTYRLASPVTHVSADDPPLLMIHGIEDKVLPLSQSEITHTAYQETGLTTILIAVANAGHGFQATGTAAIVPSREEIEQRVLDFFVEHLVLGS